MYTQFNNQPARTNRDQRGADEGYESNERGQATIALAGVVALTVLLGLGLAVIAQAMVHRSRARNAADAVALASLAAPAVAADLSDWYQAHGVRIEIGDGHARASSGPSQAVAWAGRGESIGQPAPVVRAIVARAEQLIGTTFLAPRLQGMRVELSAVDASLMQAVAAELGLCVVVDADLSPGWEVYEVC